MKKRLKILTSIFLILVMTFSALSLLACKKEEASEDLAGKRTLYVLNWGDYIAKADDEMDSVIKEFEKANPGVKVVYTTADTNELMLNMVLGSDAEVDLLCPSDYAIEKLIRQDKIQKLDKTLLPNIGNI